jgi:glycerol-3-phosphate O-acyltransferase
MLKSGRLLSRASERLFRHIEVDASWRHAIESAGRRGPVIYVLRNVSVLDYLALEHLTHRFDLPRIGFVNELAPALTPQSTFGANVPAEQLRATVAQGQSAALFLKRPPSRLATAASGGPTRGRSEGAELLSALLDLQAQLDLRAPASSSEIMMMPQTFLWTQRPERRGFSIVDSVFGPAEFPGEMRQAAQFLLNYKNGLLRAGEALSLRDFQTQQGDDGPTDAKVRRLTYALLRKVERERRTIVGPAHKPPDRVREEVLRSPRLQKIIGELAGPGAEPHALLTAKASSMLKAMQTTPDVEAQRSIELLAQQVLDRVYSGVDVDMAGLERLRELHGEGSVVLLPSHKSHVDYIVLSYVLRQNAIQLPVIAAGDNLSFFPAGPLLRRCGAFFIRRRFRGDKLYTAVLDAYVRRLLRDGWMLELFLEGGRSRTGKLIPPMLGLLNMVVSSALGLKGRRVIFQPVAIGYERLMEEGAFAREISGEKKKPEAASELLKLPSVLQERWGRISIQFGEPMTLDELCEGLSVGTGPVSPAKRRAIVKRLAHQVMSEINRVTALTPGSLVALVLLSHRGGMSYRELAAHCARLTLMLLRLGARATPSLVHPGGSELRETGLREVLRLYVKSGLVEQHLPGDTLTADARKRAAIYSGSDAIFTLPANKRLRLDLAKNHVIHWLVDRSLIAVALLCRPAAADGAATVKGPALQLDTLRERVQSLSRLFKYEFMFRADAPFDDIFNEVLSDMVTRGELAHHGSLVILGPGHAELDGRGWLTFYASVVRNFIEAYRIAAVSLNDLLKGALSRKELLKRALRRGERMFLRGEVQRSESVSGPMIDNALTSFCDQGYLVRGKDTLELAESFRSEAGTAAIEGRIAAYLRRRADDELWG